MSDEASGAWQPPGTAEETLAYVSNELARGEVRHASEMLAEGTERFAELESDPVANLLAGRCAQEREEFRTARKHYRLALADPRTEVEALYRLGRTWIESGWMERAIFPLRRLADHHAAHIPYRVHANSALAVAYSGVERLRSAEKAIEKAASPGLISGQLLADEAFRLTTVGGADQAKQQLLRALQIDAECVDAHLLLANLLHISGDGDDAIEVLIVGLQNAPENLKLLALLAEVQYSAGEYREAAAIYQRCLELSPKGANAASNRMSFARCFYHGGRATQAVVELELLIKQHPNSSHRHEAEERIASLREGNRGGARLPAFPRTLQRRNYCAPNTIANVLRYFGMDATQDDVAERVLTNGTRWHDLISFLDNLDGMRVYAFRSNREQIFSLLEREIPVIVGEYEAMDGHSIALVGYDTWSGVFFAQDPNFFDPVEITFGQFERSWAYTDQLAVVVVPDDASDDRTSFVDGLEHADADVIAEWLHALRVQANGEAVDAAELLEKLVKKAPQLTAARRTLVEARMQSKDFTQAYSLLAGLRVDIERPHPYWLLRYSGDVALRMGRPDDAVDYYAEAKKITEEDAILHYVEAEIALALDKHKRGRMELIRSLEVDPAMNASRLRLARECLESEEFKPARYHAEAALEIAPDSAKARTILDAANAALGIDAEDEADVSDDNAPVQAPVHDSGEHE